MFELRWLERIDRRVLQFRQMTNIEEVGIQEPIWSEWQDVPVVQTFQAMKEG